MHRYVFSNPRQGFGSLGPDIASRGKPCYAKQNPFKNISATSFYESKEYRPL